MTPVEKLIAKSEITELIHTYPRGLDRLDPDILRSIAHPDATMEFAPLFKGKWTEFVDWLMKAHTVMLYNNHHISNMLIEVNGDRAASETTSTATLIAKRDDGNFEDRRVYSRYLDSWGQFDGRWLLKHRTTVREFRRVTVITAEQLKSYELHHAEGRSDPSYAHLTSVR